MLARYDPILSTEALSNVSRTLETFLIAIRNTEIQWNVVTRAIRGGMIFSFFSFVSNPPSNPFSKIVVPLERISLSSSKLQSAARVSNVPRFPVFVADIIYRLSLSRGTILTV